MKVVLVGEFRSGKTRAFNRLLKIVAINSYEPTRGANVGQYKNANGTVIDVWDIAGNEKYPGLREGYFIGANVCFVFGSEPTWIRDFIRTVPDASIYLYTSFGDFKLLMDKLV
jgi:GTP-binding nuclear protein Ran